MNSTINFHNMASLCEVTLYSDYEASFVINYVLLVDRNIQMNVNI